MILPLWLALAPAQEAQDPGFFALGRDQAQFARGLSDAGYLDLAEQFCSRVEAAGVVSATDLAALRAVHLDLELDSARRIAEPVARKNELVRIAKAKEDFITSYPKSPEARQAQDNLPEIYRLLGEAYTAALQKTSSPDELVKLRAEGNEVFKHSEESLGKAIESIDAGLASADSTDAETEALTRQHISASYNLARTYYFHSLLLPPEDLLRETYLERCIELFDDFSLDYGDTLLSYSGMIFKGLANHMLERDDDALADFDAVLDLRSAYLAEDGTLDLAPEAADIISQAVLQKVNLLASLKRYDEVRAAADQFLAQIPGATESDQGLAVVAARMQAELDTGDTAAASETAQVLVDKDPKGSWGARGREVLGSLLAGGGASALDQKQVLKIAESLLGRKDYAQAVALCRQVIGKLRAQGDGRDDIAQAFVFIAYACDRLNQPEEAALAYDAAFEASPTSARAPDALYGAYLEYRSLYGKQRKTFYDKRAEDRMGQLASRFPEHPKAAENQLAQAQRLEEDDKFVEAADRYVAVTPESPVYQKAQYRAGTCLYQEAARLAKAKSIPEAKALAVRAEQQLRKAQKVLDEAAGRTLELDRLQEFQTLSFQAQERLGDLFMLPGLGREADALALSKEIEEHYAGDDERVGSARSLRVRILSTMGQLDEAMTFLESLLAKDASSKATAAAAGVLARTLDQKAVETLEKDKTSRDVENLWKQAFRYYVLSVQPKLGDPASAGEIAQIADRLYVMALHFNGVPERLQSRVGWFEVRPKAPEYWEKAAQLYEASMNTFPIYGTRVSLARTYAFLDRHREAADLYTRVIEDDRLIDSAKNEIDRGALSAKPELLPIYLELGASILELGRQENDPSQLQNAIAVFDRVLKVAPKATSETWWQAKHLQVATWMDQGDYKKANFAIRDLERYTQNFDEGKYGLDARFRKMKSDLEKKVF